MVCTRMVLVIVAAAVVVALGLAGAAEGSSGTFIAGSKGEGARSSRGGERVLVCKPAPGVGVDVDCKDESPLTVQTEWNEQC